MHYGQRAALERLWPETEVDPCEWHLRHVFERLLSDERRGNPQHADAIDALAPRIELPAHKPGCPAVVGAPAGSGLGACTATMIATLSDALDICSRPV
jgi:hypothetical protein